MIFSVDRKELCASVANLSRVVGNKTAIPVLEGILITAKQNEVELVSYNLETGMNKTIPASVKEEGAIVISAKFLNSILHSMNGEVVKITADERLMCHLECGTAVFDMMGMAAVDFPEIPSVSEGTNISIEAGILKDMVRQTIFAVANTEGSRPILTGINFELEDGNLKLIAIDGFRLAIRNEKVNIKENISFVASGRAINEVVKIISEDDTLINICVGRRHVCISFDGYTFISRLLDGEFIDYKKTIPAGYSQKLVVNTRDIIEIIDRISLIISDNFTTPIRFIINENETVFSCATSVGKATERASLQLEGPAFEIGLNSKYLLEALRACEYEKVNLLFNGGSSAVVITPESDDSFTYMIMPMRLR